MIEKRKSVVRSKAGETLVNVSGWVLFFGIVATIIIFVCSFHDSGRYTYTSDIVFDWSNLPLCIEVLFSSIFLYTLGKTIAKIANYAEAIYKNVNPDFIHDLALEAHARFLPGDEAIWTQDDTKKKVKVKEYKFTADDRIASYICTLEDGSEEEIRSYELDKE